MLLYFYFYCVKCERHIGRKLNLETYLFLFILYDWAWTCEILMTVNVGIPNFF
jgi:hypothetical protein